MPSRPDARRAGYLTIDAMVALSVAGLAVAGAVALAATTVVAINQARDRLAAARVADRLYQDLYRGARPEGEHEGTMDGRSWRYSAYTAGTPETPSIARKARISVDRRLRDDLVVDAYLPPAPATASSNFSSP